jgi:hypothetical protein
MKAGHRATNPIFRPTQSCAVAERQPDRDRQNERQRDEQGEREPDHQSPLASQSATNVRRIGSNTDSTISALRRRKTTSRPCEKAVIRHAEATAECSASTFVRAALGESGDR